MIDAFVRAALREDLGRGDLFARVMPTCAAHARIVAKSDGVLCGVPYGDALARMAAFGISWHVREGEAFARGAVLARLEGDAHTLLACERTLLNMILHASSIATLTRRYVEKVAPYGVKLLDTRKTRPLLRDFEKYATRIGGATNHRMGLDDALMIKDTHLKTIDDLEGFMRQARAQIPFTCKIEIEAEQFAQAVRFMELGADIVMLDNMTPEQLAEVVAYRNTHHQGVLLEASGNITLESIERYAQSGVDAISTGALIHQANWIDLSMKME
ncbi:MAG: carboxylating nicotinate-nucleotide diphosphorylase [Campylobacterales bacterium]|nr:carboxylating nicotinate-nucleotide diphosphorylase [Campylobacterales bacterium]